MVTETLRNAARGALAVGILALLAAALDFYPMLLSGSAGKRN